MSEFQPDKATLVWQLPFEGAWPTSVTFLGSSRRLAAGNRQGQIFIWELPEADQAADQEQDDPGQAPPSRRLDGHSNAISHLLCLDDGRTLVSASFDHTVRLWDLTAPPSATEQVVMDQQTRQRQANRQRSEEALEAPGIEVEVQTDHQVLEGHREWVKALGVSADQRRLISGDDNAQVIVWDLESRQPVCQWSGNPLNWISSVALSPDGQQAFVGEYRYKRGDFDLPPAQARLWNVADGQEILDLLKVQFPDVKVRDNSYGYAQTWRKFIASGLVAAAFSPDGKLLALGQGGEEGPGQVHLVEVASGKLLHSVAGHRYGVTGLTFSADGRFVLSSGRDTTIRICRVEDGEQVAELGKPRGGQFSDWLHALSLAPDQQWLAAADISGLVQVWNV